MKKFILICALFVSTIFLMACESKAVSAASLQGEEKGEESPVLVGDAITQLRFSQGTLIHGNGQGCYLTLPSQIGRGDLIYYADYQTQQLIELCTQPNCTHDNSACTAWISCPANIPYIAVTDEKLVLIYPGNPYFFEKYGEAALPKIETRDLAGHLLKELTKFTSGAALAHEYAINDNDLYVFEKDVSVGTLNVTKTLVKVDLSSGKKETVTSFQPKNHEDYFLIGTTDNEFIIKKISAQETSSKDPEEIRLSQMHELFTVDLKGNRSPVFKEWKHLDGLEGFVDNKIFYVTDGELRLLLTNENTIYKETIKNEIFEPSEINFITYSEPNVIISSSLHRNENFDAPIFYSANLQTGEIKELSAITGLGDDSNFTFYAQTEKEFFVLYYNQKTDKDTFALVNKESLWSNRSEWVAFSAIQ